MFGISKQFVRYVIRIVFVPLELGTAERISSTRIHLDAPLSIHRKRWVRRRKLGRNERGVSVPFRKYSCSVEGERSGWAASREVALRKERGGRTMTTGRRRRGIREEDTGRTAEEKTAAREDDPARGEVGDETGLVRFWFRLGQSHVPGALSPIITGDPVAATTYAGDTIVAVIASTTTTWYAIL
ncbi:hypothetical protein QTP88_024163 [Uroleucon formosanum]